MKIFSILTAVLCLAGNCVAQHLYQIDDGHGGYLLLAPPPALSGSRILILPMPPLTPIAAGFIGAGTATGQIPIWDNLQLAWLAATPNAALNAMLPSQTGNAGRVLFTDGTNTGWTAISAGGAISVFGRTGIVTPQNGDYNFSQISGSAAASQLPNLQNLNGLLDIAHGGTGQVTANDALNSLLPNQSGNVNKILQSDGTNTSWVAISPGGVISAFGRTGAVTAQANDYSFSQLSGSANAAQLPNLQNLNGLLDIAHGGTGQITANAALNALLPTQTGNANKVLQTDGTNTTWIGIISPPVNSVFGRTGIITSASGDYSFSQISGSATAGQLPSLQNMNGLLDIGHGGTGQITGNAALNALLPTQTGNANKVLQTDGTNTTWIGLISPPVTSVFGRTGIIISASGDYSFSQISGSATAGQLPNLQNMNGLLDIAHGGTGQTTANSALNALLPDQTGNSNKVLQTDGTNTSWVVISSAPVSSVFGRTGIVVAANNDYSFSQISGSAVAGQLPNIENMNGLLDIAHGGTGQTTANSALNALLPDQTGNSNKVLQSDGTNVSWISPISPLVSSVFGRTGSVISAIGDYNFLQISGSATAGQLPNLENMNGLLDIAHGGTGQITANAALNALLPTQTGNTNKVLQTDGTNTTWVGLISPSVTSVFGRTGDIVSSTGDYNFSQISGSATAGQLPNLQNMNGLLDLAHGGTGQTTANAALNALLPTQTGNANKLLQSDGTNASWISPVNPLVSSVFGRTGSITSVTGDYSFSQISGNATASQLPNLQNLNGILDVAHGGSGISSCTKGDLLYASAANTLSALAGNTSSTKKFLIQTGNGSVSAAPAWDIIAANDLPVFAEGATHNAGAVPDPGATSGTTKFLREDGTWQIPAGGGTGTVTSVGLSMPAEFSTGAAITTSGNLSASWTNQTANKVFASPDGSTGTPSFRALTVNDISAGMITYAKIQTVAANSILGNNTGSGATAIELSSSQVKTMLALNNVENTALSTWSGSANITTVGTIGTGTWNATLIGVAKGGTGLSSYILGDMLYASAGTTLTILSGNTTSTKKFLTQSGNGSVSAAPIWNTIAAGDMPVMIASGGSHAAGAVPDPGSTVGTTKFLREDGSWQVPAGGGGGTPAGSNTEIQYNNSGAFGSSSSFVFNNGGVSVANATTTDEQYALRGDATANGAGVQNIGVWGRASSNNGSNIGAIGVLANGGGNTTTGTGATPNVALQINDGEFTMGRTTENAANPTDPVGTWALTNAATAGSTYSADGPSGVVTVTITGGLAVGNATSELAGLITINNKYAKSTSIVLVQIMDATVSAGNANRVAFGTAVLTRATGSFQVRVDAIANSTAGYTLSTYKIGYMILNPGK